MKEGFKKENKTKQRLKKQKQSHACSNTFNNISYGSDQLILSPLTR
jgi:hypothetical protein